MDILANWFSTTLVHWYTLACMIYISSKCVLDVTRDIPFLAWIRKWRYFHTQIRAPPGLKTVEFRGKIIVTIKRMKPGLVACPNKNKTNMQLSARCQLSTVCTCPHSHGKRSDFLHLTHVNKDDVEMHSLPAAAAKFSQAEIWERGWDWPVVWLPFLVSVAVGE